MRIRSGALVSITVWYLPMLYSALPAQPLGPRAVRSVAKRQFVVRLLSFVLRPSSRALFLRGQLLGLLVGLLDRADIHKRRLRQVIPFAVGDFLEAADRIVKGGDFAWFAGKHLGHEERLRKKPLHAAGAMHDQL